jgi:Flp pilus assembly pilin Flp
MLRLFLRSAGKYGRRLRHLNAGQDLIEYALLIALIAATVLVGLSGFGAKVPGFYEATAAALPGEGPPKGNPGNDKPVGDAGEDPGQGKGN